MKEVAEMTIPELLDRFEKDILYDCHSLRARICRSDAQKEILRRKNELLSQVEQHVASKTGSQDTEVIQAWSIVLNWMTPEVPEVQTASGG